MEEEIKDTEPEKTDLPLQVELRIGNDVKTFYANEVAVQVLHSEVVLSFFEVRIPFLMSKDSANKAIGQCVGRIAMPLGRVPAVIEALDSQFSSHLARIETLEKVEGETDDNSSDG